MTDLSLNIRDIGEAPRAVRRSLDRAAVATLLAASSVTIEPGEAGALLAAEVDRRGTTVFLRGRFTGHFYVACARCLEPARVAVEEAQLHLTFVRAPERPEEEVELTPDDLDVYHHGGRTIDLEPVLRELLVVGIPIAPLCSDACRGICTGCGRNLNLEPCACREPREPASGWRGALARLRGDLPAD